MEEQGIGLGTFILSLITAVFGGGGVGALIKARAASRETSVRGELQIVESVLSHNETLRQDISRLSQKVMQMDAAVIQIRRENIELQGRIDQLIVESDRLNELLDELRQENTRLIDRCRHLETTRDELHDQLRLMTIELLENQPSDEDGGPPSSPPPDDEPDEPAGD